MSNELLRYLPVWFVAYLFSLTCHEAAHAVAALWGGDRTAEEQATLDPTKHIVREPFGTVVLPLISFFLYGGSFMLGAASVPIDSEWVRRYPGRAAIMAASGPMANFTLALIAGLGITWALHAGMFLPAYEGLRFDRIVVGAEGEPTALTAFVSVLFSVNLILGTFNLIPLPPLDGHVVVPFFLSATQRAKWDRLFDGPGRFLGLAMAMMIHAKLFGPVFGWAMRWIYT